jgi:ADP-ribose pyrophosphatase YjhB (NUDIX family)
MKRIYREGVYGLVFTPDQKRIVLIKRGDCGIWYLPGGHIETGEPKEKAVMREVKEETGLDFQITRFVGTYDFKVLRTHPFFWDRGHVYAGIADGGILAVNEEAKKVEYFSLQNMPRGLPYFQREYINDAVNGKVHPSPVIQGIKIFGLVRILITNPQLAKYPLKLFKKLTERS